MTLRRKTLIILGLAFVALILVLYTVSVRVMLNSALRIERNNVVDDLTRIKVAMEDAQGALDVSLRDYAHWGDTYRFMQDRNQHFIDTQIIDQGFYELRINAVICVDSHGSVVLSRGYDLTKHRQVPLSQKLIDFVSSKSVSARLSSPESAVSGIISLPDCLAFISIRPVLTSTGTGPAHGYMAMVRSLDSHEISRIRALTRMNFRFDPFITETNEASYPGLERLQNGTYLLDRIDDNHMLGYVKILGVDGRSVAVGIPLKRDIHTQLLASIRYLMIGFIVTAMLFAILVLLIIELTVLRRVAHLTSSVKCVGARGEFASRVYLHGGDELSRLARVINRTLTALDRSRWELQKANEELDLRVRERTAQLTEVVEQLNTSREEYRLLVENQNDVIIKLDPSMRRLFASPSYCELFGITIEEFLNNSFEPRIHPDDMIRSDEAEKRLFERDHSCYMEQRTLTTSGWRWLAWSEKAALDDAGNVIAIVCVGRDITEQKEAEDSLRESESVLHALMECIPEGIVVVDSPGLNVRAISSYGRKMLNTSIELSDEHKTTQHMGNWRLLQSDANTPASLCEQPLTRAALDGETVTDEEWVIHVDDADEVHILCNAGPIRDTEDRVTGGVLAFRDMRSLYAEREALRQAYVRERHIAEVLQHALMPTVLINPPGFRIAAQYSPALAEAQIGGDFYDVFRLIDGRIAIAIGDIAGKGLQAAVHTAMAKYMIRAYANLDPEPASVLERVNNAMCEYTPDELFVTVFYGVLDPEAQSFTYANGGHDQPLFYSKESDRIVALHTTGRIVGVTSGAEYGSNTISYDPGDYLLLYTDGITDAGSDGEYLGIAGLMAMLSESRYDDPSEITDAVLTAALRLSGHKLRDDAAVLVIKADDVNVAVSSPVTVSVSDYEEICTSMSFDDDPIIAS